MQSVWQVYICYYCFEVVLSLENTKGQRTLEAPSSPVKILFHLREHDDSDDALVVSRFFKLNRVSPFSRLHTYVTRSCRREKRDCVKKNRRRRERKEMERGRASVNKQLEFDLSIRTFENRAVVRAIKRRTDAFLS